MQQQNGRSSVNEEESDGDAIENSLPPEEIENISTDVTPVVRPNSTTAVIQQPEAESPMFCGAAISEGQQSNYSGTLIEDDDDEIGSIDEASGSSMVTSVRESPIKKSVASSEQKKLARKFVCRYCNKAFGLMNVLKVHERIHTGEKPYTCEICHKAFNQSGSLNRHRNTHKKKTNDDKSFQCYLCSSTFLSPSKLKDHQQGAHADVIGGSSGQAGSSQAQPTAPAPETHQHPLQPATTSAGLLGAVEGMRRFSASSSSQPPLMDQDVPSTSRAVPHPLLTIPPFDSSGSSELNNLLRHLPPPPPHPPFNGLPPFSLLPRDMQLPQFASPNVPPGFSLQPNGAQPLCPPPLGPPVDVAGNSSAMLASAITMLNSTRPLGCLPNLDQMIASLSNGNNDYMDLMASLAHFFTPSMLEYFMKFTNHKDVQQSITNLVFWGNLFGGASGGPVATPVGSPSQPEGSASTQCSSSPSESMIGINGSRIPMAMKLPISSDGKRCNLCDKTFTCTSALRIHFRKHSGERPYTCIFCTKSFSQNGTLKRHYNTCKIADGRLPPEDYMSSPPSSEEHPESEMSTPIKKSSNRADGEGASSSGGKSVQPGPLHLEEPLQLHLADVGSTSLEGTLRQLIASRSQQQRSADRRQRLLPALPMELSDRNHRAPSPDVADDLPEDLSRGVRVAEFDSQNAIHPQHNGRSKHQHATAVGGNSPMLEKLYRCEPCGIYFIRAHLYQLHKSLHGPGGDFVCSICHGRADDAVQFSVHFAHRHHPSNGMAASPVFRSQPSTSQSPSKPSTSRSSHAANSYNIQNLSGEFDQE